jgi:hypothetical protein
MLQQEIEKQFGVTSREIGWQKITVILVVLATLIGLTIFLGL